MFLLKSNFERYISDHYDLPIFSINLDLALLQNNCPESCRTLWQLDVENGRFNLERLYYFVESQHALSKICLLDWAVIVIFRFHLFGDRV